MTLSRDKQEKKYNQVQTKNHKNVPNFGCAKESNFVSSSAIIFSTYN